jgi:hypothetical protein
VNIRKKLIEVSIPLEAINAASAREKDDTSGTIAPLARGSGGRTVRAHSHAIVRVLPFDEIGDDLMQPLALGLLRRLADKALRQGISEP